MNNSKLVNNSKISNLKQPIVFCLLDIDDFKQFNLIHSYEKGNDIVVEISELIKENPTFKKKYKRQSDEFIFSCMGKIEYIVENLCLLLRKIDKSLPVTASIGAYFNENEVVESEFIYSRLRSNLLFAKINGKNKICINP